MCVRTHVPLQLAGLQLCVHTGVVQFITDSDTLVLNLVKPGY
jgi:hypothetical protein